MFNPKEIFSTTKKCIFTLKSYSHYEFMIYKEKKRIISGAMNKKTLERQHNSELLGTSHNPGQYLINKEEMYSKEGQENKSWELESREDRYAI